MNERLTGHLVRAVAVDEQGTAGQLTLGDVRRRLAAGRFVWIDLSCDEAPPGELAARLGLELPRMAWLGTRGQRVRIDNRDGTGELVVPFAVGSSVVEVQAVAMASPPFLLTVHREEVPALDKLRSGAGARMARHGFVALYLFLDTAVTSFKHQLAGIGKELEDLQDGVSTLPARRQLLGLAALRRRMVALRRVIAPYADAVAGFVAELPSRDDVAEDGQRLVHALDAHLTAVCRDLLSLQEAAAHELETYATLVSMRQNQVINRLTILSTLVLPLTFLTGFFGMNFPYLVERIDGALAFWVLGVGLQLAVALAILLAIRHRGWLRVFRDTDDAS